eukprot:s2196_g9.t1
MRPNPVSPEIFAGSHPGLSFGQGHTAYCSEQSSKSTGSAQKLSETRLQGVPGRRSPAKKKSIKSRGACYGMIEEAGEATAMAALAAESVGASDSVTQESIVVDPTCGMGTLLIAAARVWPQVSQRRLRLVGRDMNPSQLQKLYANFYSCQLDTCDVRLGDARDGKSFSDVEDGSVDALLCDLPSGAAHKASSDWKSYTSFMQLAERIIRPHGRCVLLSERKTMLLRTISKDVWQTVASWVIGRGEGNKLEFLLIVLERRPGTAQRQGNRLKKTPAILCFSSAFWVSNVERLTAPVHVFAYGKHQL